MSSFPSSFSGILRATLSMFDQLLFLGFDPFAVVADEVDEAIDGFDFGDVELHRGLADVEIDFVGGAADVAEIGVGHFAGAVDDAAHDGDFDAFQVLGALLDAGGDGL